MENQNMENEYERVILSQLIERCHERLPLYDKKVVKEIIKVFLEELKDAIIHNACVVINGFFAFRHREVKERYSNLSGEPTIIPATTKIKVTFSKKQVLEPMRKYYKKTGKKAPGTLYDVPLDKKFK